MNIETHFAEQLVKFQKKFELNTVYSNPYHTAFIQTKDTQLSMEQQKKKVSEGIPKTK